VTGDKGFQPERDLDHEMAPKNPNADKTILFADDDGRLQKFVAALLTIAGYTMILANDGKDALRKAREYKGKIHLLLSDVEMPHMTGIELAIQLNQERPDTKILLISGLDTGMLVLNNGWQFLPKPFMADMLRDKVRDFLSEQPSIKEHIADVLKKIEDEPSLKENAPEILRLAKVLAEAVPEDGPVVAEVVPKKRPKSVM
jgi:DNA-binding NtrC family response regulator